MRKNPGIHGVFPVEGSTGIRFAEVGLRILSYLQERPMSMSTLITGGEISHRSHLIAALKQEQRLVPLDLQLPFEEESFETLVEDGRESMRPAQHVERKLVSLLQASPVFLSHLQKDARPQPR